MAVQLHCGDCLSVMGGIPDASVDAIVTDPPYGVGLGVAKDMRGGKHGLAKASYNDYKDTYENFVSMIVPRLTESLKISRRGAVFSGPHLQEQPKATAIGGIFCSAGTGRHSWGFKTFLPILFYGKDPKLHHGARPNVLSSNARSEKNGHPCPKPLEWMVWLIERTTLPGETVLDPFMGSGTTGVACVKTGRNFIGIEINPDYHAIAEKRIAAELDKMPLLTGSLLTD
jgi:DNA modification methylase